MKQPLPPGCWDHNCPNCGTFIRWALKYCFDCGTLLRNSAWLVPTPQDKEGRPRGRWRDVSG